MLEEKPHGGGGGSAGTTFCVSLSFCAGGGAGGAFFHGGKLVELVEAGVGGGGGGGVGGKRKCSTLHLNAHAHAHEFVLMFAAIQLPLWHSTYHAMLMLSKSKEYVLNSLDRSMSRHPEFNRRVSNKIMVMLQYKKTCPSLLISVCSSLVPIGCLSNCPSLLTMCSSSAVRDVFKFTSEPQFSTWLSLRMLWNEQLTAFFPQMKRPHSGS